MCMTAPLFCVSENIARSQAYLVFLSFFTLGIASLNSGDNIFQFWTNLAFACKTETLGSLYSHALLILCKSSGDRSLTISPVAHAQISSERRVLD